jgi:membrane dipeptidase
MDSIKRTRRQALKGGLSVLAAAGVPGLAWPSTHDYDSMLVIDALCFGREWGEDALAGLRAANYSGIIESLPRSDLQTAIDALVG